MTESASTPARVDGPPKVTGAAQYTADIRLPGMLHAKVLRSPHAHARLISVDASRARAVPGVHAVLTRDDLDGVSAYGYFVKDQPVVAIDKVRYVGDVVAAVAAEDEATALAALARITVEYEVLPSLPDIGTALSPDASELFEQAPPGVVPPFGPGVTATLRPRRNVCYEFQYETGPDSAWDECDHIFTDTFRYSRSNHFHLEPFVTVADVRGDRIEIWSSTQNPFPLRKELARVLGTTESKIRVNVPYVGGGFGSKNNCRTEPIAILLSRLSGRPVRFCLTTEEGFLTMSQHAAVVTVTTGVRADGTFVARESKILLDSGAYSDASPLVAQKSGYRMPGAYRWKHIRTSCECVMTTTTPAGPFRGYGAPQVAWASESQVDMIARRLGIDPYELRIKNFKALGEPYLPGESSVDSDMARGLDVVADELGYHTRERLPNRGMGLAASLKDGGGMNKPATARVKIASSGDVYLSCGTIEIGQGAHTALTQVVVDVLGCPRDKVGYAPVNTDATPFDHGTNASSGVAVMGQAVQFAAEDARDKVLAFAAGQLDCKPDDLTLEGWAVRLGDEVTPLAPMITAAFGNTGFEFSGEGYCKAVVTPDAPLVAESVFWENSWAGAEVEVDPDTGKVTVLQLVVSSDVGKAINALTCRGQDEGCAIMGYAQALFEEMRFSPEGVLLNGEALDYRVPLAEDLPERFVSLTQEQGHGPGRLGAKGAGEGAIIPLAAAIANAVQDAVGVRITELPLSPQRVFAALSTAEKPSTENHQEQA
ncbi:xanthine dehydrogenase family protein molybdopterin-binding subunit [Streptomyces sp. NPDC056161]|uniref:xanthine dehydrogenase family protein molybdopterin-binding subunit n=1 Tax=Streptomyces sp. NPDC056161 TaxID=3345732 RepID=UPI0035E1F8A4